MLLELGGVRLLTDPVLRDRVGHLRRRSTSPDVAAAAELDAVLLSHLHGDHADLPSLRRLDRGTRLLVPRGAGDFARRAGFAEVEELAPGDETRVGELTVRAVPAVHDERRRPLGGPRAAAIGYLIRAGCSVYFPGDTDLFDEMDGLEPGLGVALLPVWGWGPTLGRGHLDPAGAAQAAARLRPRVAVPIHWGTFFPLLSRPRDRLTAPPREFAAQVARLAPAVEVRVLEPGGSMALPEPA